MTRVKRRSAYHRATIAAGLPTYASDMRPVRGRCLRKRCGARWGVIRVSLDFRAEMVDRYATIECAACGRTWRRTRVPPITSAAGYQAVRLTLILPATMHRWYARGRWHAEGDDAIVLREATIGDLDEAARTHRAKSDKAADRRAALRAKREAADRELHERSMATLARLAAYDAENAQAEAEAAAREAAYAA